MHLLIDVRTSEREDTLHIRYAEIWARIWSSYFPHDRLTFLAYEGDMIEREDTILLSRRWGFGKKSLSHHIHGPQRIISFSRAAPIDKKIPTIAHLSDFTPLLYPRKSMNILEKHLLKGQYKKLLKQSEHIIVPHQSVREGICDFFSISGENISVLPLLLEGIGEKKNSFENRNAGEYMLTEGTPGNEWHPVDLIRQYSRYIHDLGGTRSLIILGDMGDNLGHLSSLIRSLDLISHVKLMGTPRQIERAHLYDHASTFLALGPYPSRVYSLSSALGRGIPSIFSDLDIFREYGETLVHPHHSTLLAETMKTLEKQERKTEIHSRNEAIIEEYKKIIAD